MLWPVVILIALLIPLTAIILDSPVMRAWVERRHGVPGAEPPPELEELAKKVGVLESDVDTLVRQLAQLQEEHQFLQRFLEESTRRKALPKEDAGHTGA